LETEKNAGPFLFPVDWKKMGIYDYPQIVKKPMDLSTLKKNLQKRKYEYLEEFTADLQLIWHNCKTYNQMGSEIYKQAEAMERKAKKILALFKEKNQIGGALG